MISEKVMVDTNIFLDYYLDRKSRYLPIGEFAFQFVQDTINCHYKIIISEEIIDELIVVLNMSKNDVEINLLNPFIKKSKLNIIVASNKQKFEAKNLSKNKRIPFNDCLFAIIARDLKIRLISRDKHFDDFNFVNSVTPEEL